MRVQALVAPLLARFTLAVLVLLGVAASAAAQDAGGVRLAPGLVEHGGPKGLARPLPFTFPPMLSAHDAQGGLTAADRQAQHQSMITKLRGDAGFLGGFSFGTPLAASRQAELAQSGGGDGGFGNDAGYGFRRRHQGNGPIIINNQGPLAITTGNGNVVQQQASIGALGPVAQQQVATTAPGAMGGGALNLVTPGGNIIQGAPR